jgi:hypothetical protein
MDNSWSSLRADAVKRRSFLRGFGRAARSGGSQEIGQATARTTVTPQAVASTPSEARGNEPPSRPQSAYQALEPILAMDDPSHAKVWAYNSETKAWHTYTAPKGVKVSQTGTGSPLVALVVQGEPITEVAAYSVKAGRWARQALIEPARNAIYPVVGNHLAAYFVGRHAYAFSSLTGKWSQQALNEAAPEDLCNSGVHLQVSYLLIGHDFMIYISGRSVYAFNAATGIWDTIDLGEGAETQAAHGPSDTALIVGGGRLLRSQDRALPGSRIRGGLRR